MECSIFLYITDLTVEKRIRRKKIYNFFFAFEYITLVFFHCYFFFLHRHYFNRIVFYFILFYCQFIVLRKTHEWCGADTVKVPFFNIVLFCFVLSHKKSQAKTKLLCLHIFRKIYCVARFAFDLIKVSQRIIAHFHMSDSGMCACIAHDYNLPFSHTYTHTHTF